MTAENTRNLQTSAERLVEEHTGLKFWNEWKPGKECNRSEEEQTHDDLVTTGECSNGSPEASSMDEWFQRLSDLEKHSLSTWKIWFLG